MSFKALAVFSLAAVSAFADGVRYKDRLFDVSEAKTVTVAENVPFLDDMNGENYGLVSSMLEQYNASPMIYFYNREIVKKQNVEMDVYEPKGDVAEKRPVVIICHGGAFIAGEKDSDQQSVEYADSLAARGYVTASLGYRLGVLMHSSGDTTFVIDSSDFARSVYKALQDVHAAVRYFRANSEKYRIDTNKIYIVGNSAGAMMGLENIYAQSKSDFPSIVDKGAQLLPQEDGSDDFDTVALGGLDQYGAKGVGGVANGVVALWGAVHDLNIIKNSKVPVFLAHGDSDRVMPFGKGYAMENANQMVPSAYAFMLSALHISFDVRTPTLYGSSAIDSVLNANKVYHEFYAPRGYGLGHEFYDDIEEDKDGNEIVFADSVRNKVFAFLYNLAVDSVPEFTAKVRPLVTLAEASRISMGEGNLSFTVTRGKNVGYAVFNLKGRRELSGRASQGETVDLGVLNNGVYYLRVQGQAPRRIGIRK